MSDYCVDSGKRKTKGDKRAQMRYNKYKRGGKNRTVEFKHTSEGSVTRE